MTRARATTTPSSRAWRARAMTCGWSTIAALEIAPGTCESGAVDCTPIGGLGHRRRHRRRHVRAAAGQVLPPVEEAGNRRLLGRIVGGHRHASTGIRRLFAGLFMWEGTLFTARSGDPRAQRCVLRGRTRPARGRRVRRPSRARLQDAVRPGDRRRPMRLSPVPGFPPGTTNLQALLFAFSAPNPASPLNFTEGFIRADRRSFHRHAAPTPDVTALLLLGPLIGNYAPDRASCATATARWAGSTRSTRTTWTRSAATCWCTRRASASVR